MFGGDGGVAASRCPQISAPSRKAPPSVPPAVPAGLGARWRPGGARGSHKLIRMRPSDGRLLNYVQMSPRVLLVPLENQTGGSRSSEIPWAAGAVRAFGGFHSFPGALGLFWLIFGNCNATLDYAVLKGAKFVTQLCFQGSLQVPSTARAL